MTPGNPTEMQAASAAFALLNLSTDDNVFTPQLSRLQASSKLMPVLQTPSCSVCLGQSIQRKNSRLYHVKLTTEHLVDADSNTRLYKVDICGTFTDLLSAYNLAYTAIDPRVVDLESYESKHDFPDLDLWPYGDEVCVRAMAVSGEMFTVSIQAEPNDADLIGNSHGEVCSKSFYAVRESLRHSASRGACKRETLIEGTYRSRNAARRCALGALFVDGNRSRDDFDEWEAFSDNEDSPWGDDVVVRAVAPNGDVTMLSVVEFESKSKACGD